ncbi:hypothetical protein ACFE04_015962 [Oxalis oulophora]
MLPNLRSRRRQSYGGHVCAVTSALVLLLLSVSLLYIRISRSPPHHSLLRHQTPHQRHHDHPLLSDQNDVTSLNNNNNPLFEDEDRIDELDVIEEDQQQQQNEDIEEMDDRRELDEGYKRNLVTVSASGYYFDHVYGSIRRVFNNNNRRSIDNWDYDYTVGGVVNFGYIVASTADNKGKSVFGSDDMPVDEEVRRKVGEVEGIEDALLLKVGKRVSPLREKWGDWFDKKSDFLRRDKMFKSNLESLNPLTNPMLQDPDGVGVTGLTRGDKLVQKLLLSEFKKVPFLFKKPLAVPEQEKKKNKGETSKGKSEIKRVKKRRTLDVDRNDKSKKNVDLDVKKDVSSRNDDSSGTEVGKLQNVNSKSKHKSEYASHLFADGKRWGFYPGLDPHLSFSDFVDTFFKKGKCDMKVFIVWNSPPWMYTVRHQRGLESLLSHHKDACVVFLSETIELDFFRDSFVKDGYKIAVAMPNLDELLKDTPSVVFASVWFEWRKTKFYSTHYSELVRLAALYKYGGIYLDTDIIVLKPLSSLHNSVGLESQLSGSPLNGAVMAFEKGSPFIFECLKEFYTTYDDTRLRWNGADLLTRIAKNFMAKNTALGRLELEIQPSFVFFPISSQNITRYFTSPVTETEKAEQDALFERIQRESLTFHFWNSLTSSLIPEPDSLLSKLINRSCLRCSETILKSLILLLMLKANRLTDGLPEFSCNNFWHNY